MYVALYFLATALPVLCTVLDLKDYSKDDKSRPTWNNEFPDLMDQPFFKNEKTQTIPRRTIMTRLSIDTSNTGPVGPTFVSSDSTEAVNTNSVQIGTGELGYHDHSSTGSEGYKLIPPPEPPAGQKKEITISENYMSAPAAAGDAPGATDKQKPTPTTGYSEKNTMTDNDEVIPTSESSSSSVSKVSTNISISNDLNVTLMEIFSKISQKGPCSQLIRYPPDPNQACLTMEYIMTENRHYAGVEDMCTRIQLESFPALVDGRPTEKTEAPYQISIRQLQGEVLKKHCGGALVTSRFVLTAAICVTHISALFNYRVVGGPGALELDNDHNMNMMFWRQISCYYLNKYLPHVYYRDIAVLEVNKPFKLSAFLSPIKIQGIPRENRMATNTANRCMLTKYTNRLKSSTDETPKPAPEKLHLSCAPVLDFETCNAQFRVIFGMQLNNATDFCVGTVEPSLNCYGEPGSPLVCGGALVGIATSVHVCGKSPGLFTQLPGTILRMTQLADSHDSNTSINTAPSLYTHILLIFLLITL